MQQVLLMLIKLPAICLISLNPYVLKSDKIMTRTKKVTPDVDHTHFFALEASLDFDERVSQQVGVSLSLHEVHKFEGSEDR